MNTLIPFVTACRDYHDFRDAVRIFRDAGFELQYQEVGCGHSKWWPMGPKGYHAVFWQVGSINPIKLIDEMRKSLA